MAVHGVYEVVIRHFKFRSDLELHIKEEKSELIASVKGLNFTRTFFNGTTNLSPPEKESHNFLFLSAQVDDFINLVPRGGYHAGGVELGGTVTDDTLIGTIKFKNGLVFSVYGTRIKGEPKVSSVIRQDIILGINRECSCKTMTCTHRGFCDNCQVFNSVAGLPTVCIQAEYEKQYATKHGKPPVYIEGPLRPEDDVYHSHH